VNVVDPYEAYCLDQAVTTWGNYITSELEKIEGKDSKAVARKQRSKLLQLLGAKDSERFRTVGRSKKV
jgi:ribonuclease HII